MAEKQNIIGLLAAQYHLEPAEFVATIKRMCGLEKATAEEFSCQEDFPMALSPIRITGFFVLLAAVVSAGVALFSFLPNEAY